MTLADFEKWEKDLKKSKATKSEWMKLINEFDKFLKDNPDIKYSPLGPLTEGAFMSCLCAEPDEYDDGTGYKRNK